MPNASTLTLSIRINADGTAAVNGLSNVEQAAVRTQGAFRNLAVPAAAIVSVYALGRAVEEVATSSLGYLGQMETATLGIAASYMTGGHYIDTVTGKVLKGEASLHAAQADSIQMLKQLQYANIQTIATLDQLVLGYQQTLPVAMAKGFSRDMTQEFTTAMVQAAGAIDPQLIHQLAEETRSLLMGTISPRNSKIATILGISNDDIRENSANAQQLFDFLMGKLDGYKVAGSAAQQTWAGLWSNTKDVVLQGAGQSFEPLFEAVKYELNGLLTNLVTIDEKTKKINWNPDFIDGITNLKSGMTSVIAEVYRLNMLLDKTGGTMTAMGTAFFGKNSTWGAKLAEWNKMYADRYKASDQALQDLADREIGVGKYAAKQGQAADYVANPAKADEEAQKRAEKARKQAESISLVMAGIRERDLVIGKNQDEKELAQLDLKHQRELKQLRDLHASRAQIGEAAAAQEKERGDLATRQQSDRENAYQKWYWDMMEEREKKEQDLAKAKAQIAEKEFQARVEWQNRLDEMKVRKGSLSEEAALASRYERERQLLNVRQETLAVQIDQEKNEARRLELESEYYQLGEQILQSSREEAFDLYQLKIASQERLNQLAAEELQIQRQKYEEAWAAINDLANQAGMGPAAAGMKKVMDASIPSQSQPGIDAASENVGYINQNLTGEDRDQALAEQQQALGGAIEQGQAEDNPYMREYLQAAEMYAQKLELYRQNQIDEAALNEEYNNLKQQQDQASLNQRMAMTSGALGMMAGMAQAAYAASGNQSKAALAVFKGIKIAETAVNTYSAAMGAYNAMASIPYVGPALGAAAAAAAVAFGMMQISQIASMQPGGGASRPSMPSAGGYGTSTPNLPEYGQADAPTKAPVQQWSITFVNGTFIGSDKDAVARDLAPAIMKAVGDGVH